MSARKRSSSRVLSTPPWRRYSKVCAIAPAGASESSASSASGSDSPPSRISATPSRSHSARSVATPSGHARRPPSRRTTTTRAPADERLDVIDEVRRAHLREVRAELAHGVRRRRGSRCRRSSGDGASDHRRPFGGTTLDEVEQRGRVDVLAEPVGEPVEMRLADGGERRSCPGVQSRPRRSATHVSSLRRNASPSSRPCQLVPRTSRLCSQRARRCRCGRGGSRSRSPRRPRRCRSRAGAASRA